MGREPLRDILSRSAPAAFEGFMARWHGLVPGQHGGLLATGRLPRALRRVYEAFGTAPRAFLLNRLLAPADIAEDNGFTVFYVEEQAVYLWGISNDDLDDEDPPVWCRENEPGKPWAKESPAVSVFMVQMVVMSAALDGPHSAAAASLSPQEAERVLSPLQLLDLPPWHWPGDPARWYAGDDTVGFTCPNLAPDDTGERHLSVWVSSLTEEGIRFIEPHLGDAWEYYSPRDT
jgi:hypothetical protein